MRGRTASATTAATAGSTSAPRLKKRLLRAVDILDLSPLKLNMSGLPTITLSNGFPRTDGAPPVAATARPNLAAHPKDLPPVRASAPNTGNPKLDQKYQQQQQSVIAKQNQQRQQLQQKQDQEHQQLTQQKAPPARTQQAGAAAPATDAAVAHQADTADAARAAEAAASRWRRISWRGAAVIEVLFQGLRYGD